MVGSFRKLALGEPGEASVGTYKLGKLLAIFRKLASGELGEASLRYRML